MTIFLPLDDINPSEGTIAETYLPSFRNVVELYNFFVRENFKIALEEKFSMGSTTHTFITKHSTVQTGHNSHDSRI